MKKTKRNIAIIVVLLFVCAAIYFNWSYNTQRSRQRRKRPQRRRRHPMITLPKRA